MKALQAKEARKPKVLHCSKLLGPQNMKKASTKETKVGSTRWEIVKNQDHLEMNQSRSPLLLFISLVVWVEGSTKVRHYWGLVWYSGASTFVWSWLTMEVIIWRGPVEEILEERQGPLWDVKTRKQRCLQGLPCEQLQKLSFFWDRVAVEEEAVSFLLCCLTLLLNIQG